MFFLRHMPTATYYSLTNDVRNSLHHRVCFEKYEDALHVGKSLVMSNLLSVLRIHNILYVSINR